MTEITEGMIERGMRELEDWPCWRPAATETSRMAAVEILTAALSHDTTESKEKQAMKRRAIINHVSVKIENDEIAIGTEGGGMWFFNRKAAPDLVAFIQQWLDHDPEEELRQKVQELALVYPGPADNIIAAVREHDHKYGRPE